MALTASRVFVATAAALTALSTTSCSRRDNPAPNAPEVPLVGADKKTQVAGLRNLPPQGQILVVEGGKAGAEWKGFIEVDLQILGDQKVAGDLIRKLGWAVHNVGESSPDLRALLNESAVVLRPVVMLKAYLAPDSPQEPNMVLPVQVVRDNGTRMVSVFFDENLAGDPKFAGSIEGGLVQGLRQLQIAKRTGQMAKPAELIPVVGDDLRLIRKTAASRAPNIADPAERAYVEALATESR